jgi:hypothetical protein
VRRRLIAGTLAIALVAGVVAPKPAEALSPQAIGYGILFGGLAWAVGGLTSYGVLAVFQFNGGDYTYAGWAPYGSAPCKDGPVSNTTAFLIFAQNEVCGIGHNFGFNEGGICTAHQWNSPNDPGFCMTNGTIKHLNHFSCNLYLAEGKGVYPNSGPNAVYGGGGNSCTYEGG